MSGNAGCIVLLAQAGADLNTTDAHGSYPIHYASNMAKDMEKLPEDAKPVGGGVEVSRVSSPTGCIIGCILVHQ